MFIFLQYISPYEKGIFRQSTILTRNLHNKQINKNINLKDIFEVKYESVVRLNNYNKLPSFLKVIKIVKDGGLIEETSSSHFADKEFNQEMFEGLKDFHWRIELK